LETALTVITFKYKVPLDQTMVFEEVYHENLKLDPTEKEDISEVEGSIFVWMFVNGELVGESYGIPANRDKPIEGLGLTETEKKSAIYCYSTTILPPLQRKGLGALLKAHWIGCAAAKGFTTVYGHARPGVSQALNAKFGAVFIGEHPDWFGTGETYKLYRLRIG
jgi:hypothetical protein